MYNIIVLDRLNAIRARTTSVSRHHCRCFDT